MMLVLVRHGKAEDRDSGKEDFIRELTSDGEKKCKKISRGLSRLLKDQKKILVISSPLKRSMQTAAIAAKAVKADDEEI